MTEQKKNNQTNSDAYLKKGFKLEVQDGMVNLTVFPSKENVSLVTVDDVMAECQKMGFYDVDHVSVEQVVNTANGVTSSLGKFEPRKADAAVTVSADNMQAWIRLSPPEPGGKKLTLEEIKTKIRLENIIYGVKEEVLQRLAEHPSYETDILIAEGRAVEEGKDADYLYYFEAEKKIRPMAQDESGRVDYKELNLIENVVEGQHLATKIPPQPGAPGITVKNEYIAPKAGKDKPFVVGKNVTLSEDGLEAHAATNGAVMLLGGKITVSQIYQIKGSVGASTGNVNFLGSVVVSDSVEEGFSVKATETVSVGKTVGKAVVEAGGDVTVRGGIIESKIISGGDVRAKFVETSDIDARDDIVINEALLHSNVQSGGQIIVGLGGRKGTIAGGQIRAYKRVSCKTLGSPMSTKTNVDVGINPKLLSRMEELQSGILKDRENFENIQKGISALTALKEKLGNLPQAKQKILETLSIAMESLKTKLQEMAAELRDIQTQTAVKVKAMISVSDEAFPGIKMTIGSINYYTTREEKYVTFKEEGGEVRIFPYEAPKLKKDKNTKDDTSDEQ